MAMECLTPVALLLSLCVYVSFEQPEYTLNPPTSECVEFYHFREMCPQSYGNESWWFSGIPSLYACAARCQEDTNCLSFVYTAGNDECTTNAEKATTFNDTCEENVMYGQLESVCMHFNVFFHKKRNTVPSKSFGIPDITVYKPVLSAASIKR